MRLHHRCFNDYVNEYSDPLQALWLQSNRALRFEIRRGEVVIILDNAVDAIIKRDVVFKYNVA